MTTTPATRILHDRESAAEQLSTSVRRVEELRRGGQLMAVQDGREYKYPHSELVRYAESLPPYEPRRSA